MDTSLNRPLSKLLIIVNITYKLVFFSLISLIWGHLNESHVFKSRSDSAELDFCKHILQYMVQTRGKRFVITASFTTPPDK